MTSRTFSAVLHREDNLYVAECPEVGTISQGETVEEAIANLKEATELYLEEFPLPDTSRPILTSSKEGPIRGALIFGRYLGIRPFVHWNGWGSSRPDNAAAMSY